MSLFVRFFALLMTGLCLGFPSAWAGSVQVLSSGPLLADGQTESVVQLHVPGLTQRARVKVKSRGGRVVSQYVDAQGTITLGILPKAVTGATTMPLSVRIRGPFKLDEQVALAVRPPAGVNFQMVMEPQQLRPGQSEAVVSILMPEGGHLPPDARKLEITASVGQVSGLRYNGGGSWSATYTAPKNLRQPVSALLTAVDLTAPEQVAAMVTLPVRVSRSETFTGPPGGRVVVMDGNKEYGPALVSPAGTVAFDMDLLPGETAVEVVRFARGQERSQTVETVLTQADPQLSFVGLPSGMNVPVGRPVRLLLAHTDGAGVPISNAQNIRVVGPGHPVLEALGGGWYEVQFNSPREPSEFEVSAHLGEQSVRLPMKAVTGVPVLSASMDPPGLNQKRSISATVFARDEQGAALAGQKVALYVSGGRVSGRLRDGRDGSYSQSIQVDADSATALVVPYAATASASLPPAAVRVWSAFPSAQVANGSLVPVFVVVEDAMGLPVRNADIRLKGPVGVELPPNLSTGESGIAIAEFRSGSLSAGPALVVAESGGIESQIALWVMPQGGVLNQPVRLGSPWERAAVDRWRAGLPVSVIQDAPAVVVARPAAEASAPSPAPSPANPAQQAVDAPALNAGSMAGLRPDGMGSARGLASSPTGSAFVDQEEVPFLQARLGLSSVGLSFEQTHQDEEGLATVPSDAAYKKGLPLGVVGLKAHVLARVMDDSLHVELDARWGSYALRTKAPNASSASSDEESFSTKSHSLTNVLAGAKYRHPFEVSSIAARVEGGMWFHRSNMLSFAYDETRGGAQQLSQTLQGARIGAGLGLVLAGIEGTFLLAETFAPAPVATHFGFSADADLDFIELAGRDLSIRLDWSMMLRHVNRTVQGVDVKLTDRLHTIGISAGIDL